MDDKTFTNDLLDYLDSNYCIDPQRVYASGKSDGGGMCDVLACNATVGQRFAAFAPVAGAFYTDVTLQGCSHAPAPIPILEFHDTDDETIRYNGSRRRHGGRLPAIPDWLGHWAVRNGLSRDSNATTSITDDNGKLLYTTINWSRKDVPDVVSHYKSERRLDPGVGKDHIWPNLTNSYIDASSLAIDFFNKHPKRTVGQSL